tara:strand:+ start:2308 stop:2580 length:273 start_codon:yes stop_codon:yes gene_type:complete
MPSKIDPVEAINNAQKDIIDILTDLKITLGIELPTKTKSFKTGSITAADKAKIVRLCKTGYSTHQIAERFTEYSVMQISAIKAHITMGTY